MTEEILAAAKPLPRTASGAIADTFQANGNTYRWLDISEIGIEAWTDLTNLMDVFFSGKESLQAVRDYIYETAVKANGYTDLNECKHYVSTRLQGYLDSIIDKNERRYQLAMHIAATLCLKEGDDIRAYSTERTDSYISDWVEEGYSHIDFFTIAGGLSAQFRENFRQTKEKILALDKLGKAATATKTEKAK